MFGLGKPKRVTEWEADGEIEQIYHQIKQSLRVSGVNLNFRTWAGYPKYFSDLWAQVRPMVETRAFEEAADDLRAQAVGVAQNLTPLNSATRANPGESQSYQIKAALDLYHYVNPKLLLLTSAVRDHVERKMLVVRIGQHRTCGSRPTNGGALMRFSVVAYPAQCTQSVCRRTPFDMCELV